MVSGAPFSKSFLQIPWDGYTNDAIESGVRSGQRMEDLVRQLATKPGRVGYVIGW